MKIFKWAPPQLVTLLQACAAVGSKFGLMSMILILSVQFSFRLPSHFYNVLPFRSADFELSFPFSSTYCHHSYL